MANADKPKGFRFGYTTHGGPPAMRHYQIAGTANIYNGDIVYMSAGRVLAATAGSLVPIGVAAGFTESTSTTTTIPVYDDLANTVFIAQVDDTTVAGSSLTGHNIYYDVNYGTPSTASVWSLMEIDGSASTHDTLVILDKVDRPDNAWGGYVDVYCQIITRVPKILSAPAAT